MGGRIFHQTHWAPLLQMQGSISEVKLELVHGDGTDDSRWSSTPSAREHRRRARARDRGFRRARSRQVRARARRSRESGSRRLVAEATRLHADAKDRALFAEQMIGIVSHDLRNPLSSDPDGRWRCSRERPSRTPAANFGAHQPGHRTRADV